MENEERKRSRFPGYDMEAIDNTYKCLRGLSHWKRRVVLLRADIEDLEKRIKADAVPGVSDMASQGRSGFRPVKKNGPPKGANNGKRKYRKNKMPFVGLNRK